MFDEKENQEGQSTEPQGTETAQAFESQKTESEQNTSKSSFGDTFNESFENLKSFAADTEDKTADFDQEDIERTKVVSAIAYFGILFFLPLVTNPQSRFGRFHANQGLMLLILSVIGNTILGIIPLIGWILLPVFNLIVFIFFVMGFVSTIQGKAKRLPVIGKYDLIK